MAGPFLTLPGGRLIRPAQAGGESYGSALHLLEVVELSAASYHETLVETITPTWSRGLVGVHHVSSCADVTVFDAARSAWKSSLTTG